MDGSRIMDQVHIGVIGCGNMANFHMAYFDKIAGLKLAAVADNDPAALKRATDKYAVPAFDDPAKLLDSGLVNAVLIATPHYFHPLYAIAAFERGIHVLSEKPVAVTALAAQECNAHHAKYPHTVYAAMFNQRTNLAWKKVKELIVSGELGELRRITWIITNWFRTQAYYNSGGWRATWKGEGGGVLLNQCPHNLDLFQWFVGMPAQVTATVGLGKHHNIEVEDDVVATMTFPNGATGQFITTTGEAPGTNRLEIAGDKGKIVTDGGPFVEFVKNEIPARHFLNTSSESFAAPRTSKYTIEVGRNEQEHKTITQNFVDHLLKGEPLIAPAEEGLHGLELGNAMLMSGLTARPVPIPTDRTAYQQLIDELIRKSTFQKKTPAASPAPKADMTSSFR